MEEVVWWPDVQGRCCWAGARYLGIEFRGLLIVCRRLNVVL